MNKLSEKWGICPCPTTPQSHEELEQNVDCVLSFLSKIIKNVNYVEKENLVQLISLSSFDLRFMDSTIQV